PEVILLLSHRVLEGPPCLADVATAEVLLADEEMVERGPGRQGRGLAQRLRGPGPVAHDFQVMCSPQVVGSRRRPARRRPVDDAECGLTLRLPAGSEQQ